MSKLITLTFSLLLTFNAHAGIRIINGGGGYAEMKALTAFARLKFLLLPCLKDPQLCNLTNEDHQYLRQQMGAGFFDTAPVTLEFHDPFDEQDLYHYSAKSKIYSVASNLLYNPDGAAKSYSEIARLIFVGWTKNPGGRDLEETSHKIFRLMTTSETEVPLNLDRKIHLFNVQSKVQATARQSFLILQSANGSMDITSVIADATLCKGSAKILEISGLAFEPPMVTGLLKWSCDNDFKQAQFALQTSVLRASIFKQVIAGDNCEERLK